MLLFFIVSKSHNASACVIQWYEPETFKNDSNVVVEAEILSNKVTNTYFSGVDYQYNINIEKVLKGDLKKGEYKITFEDHKMHHRGETLVCPLKRGSGIEQDLKIHSHYKIYLLSTEKPEVMIAEEIK